MADSGETKIIAIITICIMLISIGLSGCVEEDEYKPDISISNVSDQDVNATIIIIRNNDEIYNDTLFLPAHSYSKELIRVNVPDSFYFEIITDNNLSFEEEKQYSDAVTRIAISIHNDKIEINIKVS